MIKINVGSTDRALRVITGVALVLLTVGQIIGPWGWLGLLLIITGMVKFCPAYVLMKISTAKKD